MRYRLYIDESGDHVYPETEEDNQARYLSLTGVAIEDGYYRDSFAASLDDLKKQHFPMHHPDNQVILVRRQIMERKGPFGVLLDEDRNYDWEYGVVQFLLKQEYKVITVVLDKWAHKKRYRTPLPPYHYCMEVLMERYHGFLERANAVGDMMAESRSGNLDLQLKEFYNNAWFHDTRFVTAKQYQERLTSRDLKVKKKTDNVPGLQIADMLAAPAKLAILNNHGRLKGASTSFTRMINGVTNSRYPYACRKFLDTK